MRVTSSMMLRSTLRDLNQSMSRLQATQTKLTSGREMPTASANPTKAADAMRLRQQLNRANQRESALDDAQGWLETADSTMTTALQTIGRAKEVAVRAANTGSNGDPVAMAGMALEIKSIREEMIAVANTKYGTRSVFGGTVAGPAYTSGGAYLGNSSSVLRDVAPQTTMAVNVTGTEIFGIASGAGGTPVGDMFEVLDRLAAAISTGNGAAIAAEHTNLDAATAQMGSATVIIGTKGASIEQLRARSTDDKLSLTTRLNDVESVDVVESLLTAKAQENAYQAALQVAAKIMPVSLLDYLR